MAVSLILICAIMISRSPSGNKRNRQYLFLAELFLSFHYVLSTVIIKDYICLLDVLSMNMFMCLAIWAG